MRRTPEVGDDAQARLRVSESVRARLHELNAQAAPGVAQDVAVAMVRGAGQAYREIVGALDGEAVRLLLRALQLDAETVIAALVH